MEVTATSINQASLDVVFLDILNSSIIGNYCLASKLFVSQEIIEQVNVHLLSRTLNKIHICPEHMNKLNT